MKAELEKALGNLSNVNSNIEADIISLEHLHEKVRLICNIANEIENMSPKEKELFQLYLREVIANIRTKNYFIPISEIVTTLLQIHDNLGRNQKRNVQQNPASLPLGYF